MLAILFCTNAGSYSKMQVEGQPFHAHKILLVTASERFRHMLTGNFAESKQRVITLPDIGFTTFRILMEFLYTGTMQALSSQPCTLVSTASC